MSIVLAALLSAAISGAPFPTRKGQCDWVHGSFRISNGSSIQRIWIIGTRHKVALRDGDNRYPPALRRIVESKAYSPFDSAVSGRYRVCALERWIPGHMQHVRMVDARSLVLFGK